MLAFRDEETRTWHLVGSRGCGARPDGEAIDDVWQEIRDQIEMDTGTRCEECNWPLG